MYTSCFAGSIEEEKIFVIKWPKYLFTYFLNVEVLNQRIFRTSTLYYNNWGHTIPNNVSVFLYILQFNFPIFSSVQSPHSFINRIENQNRISWINNNQPFQSFALNCLGSTFYNIKNAKASSIFKSFIAQFQFRAAYFTN